MRMNPRNIAFLAVLIVIMAVLIFLGTQGDGDEAIPTPDTVAETGSLLPEIDQEAINRFEVRELPQTPEEGATEEPTNTPPPPAVDGTQPTPMPEGPAQVIMRKNADGFWVITDDSTFATDRGVDQVTATGTVGIVTDLEYADRFVLSETGGTQAAFGLDEPQYEIIVATTDEEYRIFLGNQNPGGTRYYVQLNEDDDTVYLVVSDILDNVVNTIQQPPYVPPPTPTVTPTRTPNPFSEVEQTQTAEAGFAMTETAIATEFGTPPGPAPAGPAPDVTEELGAVETEEAIEEPAETEEATEEPIETEEATEES